tara:strand:- start:2954 stop:4450 length:1497 start_codon:yes stop_codon:yes gene_type:complete
MASNINIYDLITLAKNSVDANDFLELANSSTKQYKKISVSTLFPSLSTSGTSSEALFVSTTNKNQLNFKGIKSGDTGLLTVATTSNNIVLTALEAGIDLSLCDNTTSEFSTGVDFTGTITGENAVANGGTGLSTIAKGAMLYANAADSIAATSALSTNGQILIGNATTGFPSVAGITGGTNMTVSAGAGTITLDANQTNAEANFDLRNAAGDTTYNIDTHAGDGWIAGDGTDGGLTVDASDRVYIGATGTKVFSEILTLAGNLRFTGAATIKNTAVTSSATGTALTIESGGSADGNSGHLNLTSGTASGTGTGGSVIITAGKGATDGDIQLKTYTGSTATAAVTIGAEGQDVTVNTGDVIMSTGNVYMRNSSNPDVIKYQGTPANTDDGTAVVSAANILTGIVTCTPTADRSKATDTAANLISGLSLTADQDAFDFSLINLTTDGQDNVTLTGGTDVSLVGNMVIHAQDAADDAVSIGVGRFRIRRTASDAVTMYRIG